MMRCSHSPVQHHPRHCLQLLSPWHHSPAPCSVRVSPALTRCSPSLAPRVDWHLSGAPRDNQHQSLAPSRHQYTALTSCPRSPAPDSCRSTTPDSGHQSSTRSTRHRSPASWARLHFGHHVQGPLPRTLMVTHTTPGIISIGLTGGIGRHSQPSRLLHNGPFGLTGLTIRPRAPFQGLHGGLSQHTDHPTLPGIRGHPVPATPSASGRCQGYSSTGPATGSGYSRLGYGHHRGRHCLRGGQGAGGTGGTITSSGHPILIP